MTLKYLSSAALAALSSIAFSGTMGPVCSTEKLGLSCDSGWSIGAQALYLQPTFGDDLRFIGTNVNGSVVERVENAPDWSWGFKLEGLYHFQTGSDVALNWYHLDGQRTNLTATHVFFNAGAASSISVKPQWDAVNLELGKPMNIGPSKRIRVHAGAQYAYLKTSLGFNGLDIDGIPYSANPTAKFQGVGPRIGADLAYEFSNAFSIYTKLATALLAGNSRFDDTNTIRTLQVDRLTKTTVVPEIEAKLGINYNFNLAQNALTLDAGYMWVNYFNAQQTFYGADPDNNFSMQGPYAGLRWTGNV